MDMDMKYVARIHLKTTVKNGQKRQDLIDFCLDLKNTTGKQYLAIGWSYVYEETNEIKTFDDFYNFVDGKPGKINSALNLFNDTKEGQLFWTRDLQGNYWVCRATGVAEPNLGVASYDLDIGTVIPVKAYKYGMSVPGQICTSFNRPRGGIVHRIEDKSIIEFSKYAYNTLSKENIYSINYDLLKGNVIENLPPFDLEELVISYIQIKYDLYVLSNSIANKSTTIAIECEFMARTLNCKIKKAVVQVKGGRKTLDAQNFESYINDGYTVFLYANEIYNAEEYIKDGKIISISKEDDLLPFYNEYKAILPSSITTWEDLTNFLPKI